MDSTRDYSPKEIFALAQAVKRDEEPFKWLLENCKELAALCDYLSYGNDKALAWLKENHFMSLVAFISALSNEEEAISYLLKSPFKQWAAVAKAVCDNDDNAEDWLIKFKMLPYVALIESLQSQASSGSGSVGGFGGGGGSGGGFSGFGGGSSGGGGAGGAW
jgi:uncharacterized membrane protein YgcG